MYIPKTWHWVGPITLSAVAYGLGRRFDWDVYVFFLNLNVLVINAYASKFLWEAGVTWQKYEA